MDYKIYEAIDRLKCLIWGHVHEADITYSITSCHFCACLMSEYGYEVEGLPFTLNLQRLFHPWYRLRDWYSRYKYGKWIGKQLDDDDIPF